MPNNNEYLDRVRGALERFHESQKPKKKKYRKRAAPGELMSCGCRQESDEQKDLIADAKKIGYRFVWVRGEGESGRNARLVSWLKARGLVPGTPDLISLSHPGVAIELKAKCKKHTLSESQKRVIPYMREQGWVVIVAHGAEDAIEQLIELRNVRLDDGREREGVGNDPHRTRGVAGDL